MTEAPVSNPENFFMPIGPAHPDTSLVLDNDILTQWRNRSRNIEQALSDYISMLKRPPSLTSMTVFEAIYGIENAIHKIEKSAASRSTTERHTQQYRDRTEELIRQCGVLPFDETAARIAAYVFPRLSRKEQKEHWKDLLIAATAIAHRCGVATGNQRDFELISNHLPPSHQLLRLAIWKP
jgi:predicted nucleic acid-binding protein